MFCIDRPFKLVCLEKDKMYTTIDENWIVSRYGDGWIVAHRFYAGKPRVVRTLNQAVCEIKERMSGSTWHRHPISL